MTELTTTRNNPLIDPSLHIWGADVTLVPLNLCSETLDGIRNHSWSRPAPATPGSPGTPPCTPHAAPR